MNNEHSLEMIKIVIYSILIQRMQLLEADLLFEFYYRFSAVKYLNTTEHVIPEIETFPSSSQYVMFLACRLVPFIRKTSSLTAGVSNSHRHGGIM